MTASNEIAETIGTDVAIVGLAGRFPGAPDVEAFWRNICDKVESVSTFSDEELRQRGVPDAALSDPSFVKSGVVLEGIDLFDAGFFGYSPRDAENLDPQQRLFLETAWEALENAGYAGGRRPLAGIFAASSANVYLLRHLMPQVDLSSAGDMAAMLALLNANDKDSLSTRAAYKLDLRGPAVSVQTACSSSLVAVHLACRALLNHEADLMLAGGVGLNLFQDTGYRFQEGAILSPDGHCRAFDAKAAGTVLGSGAGVVVLRRLADALADGDTIHAVIKGSALNNDGAAKVGYTAPSVEGQADAILAAQAMADVSADSIGYVEAHGTGTRMGDPIEVAALTQAFRATSGRSGYCALGSVKTNVGHLDAAAGVTGLIKAVMALRHGTLPPSLHFEEANPQLALPGTPFYVNTQAKPWDAGATPRRAGVSSFGMGGTNVHVVLEEAPARVASARPSRGAPAMGGRPLLVSARSEAALQVSVDRLASHLERHPELDLGDVAHTLATGRRHFDHRAVAMAADVGGAVQALRGRSGGAFVAGRVVAERPSVAFLFPGQGSQHVGMGRGLYDAEPVFRSTVDHCCELLLPLLGSDLRDLIFLAAQDDAQAAHRLEQTQITQPALFVVEYAMAEYWRSCGVAPDAMLGHSIGEYVAACVAGVFSLEDALTLVTERGRLLQATQPGAMLAVNGGAADVAWAQQAGCDLAAVNADDLCVLAGSVQAVEAVERSLHERGAVVRRLRVSHAFHSALVEPMLDRYAAVLSRIDLREPRIPFVSNLSGHWITPQEACSADYWTRHVRGTVRFSDGLGTLLERQGCVLLEVGPGETLTGLVRRRARGTTACTALSTQSSPGQGERGVSQHVRALAQLWVAGVDLSVAPFGAFVDGRRVPLPTYAFERKSYWAPLAASAKDARPARRSVEGTQDVSDWFYVPAWDNAPLGAPSRTDSTHRGSVLLLEDGIGFAAHLARALQAAGRSVARVRLGAGFNARSDGGYEVRAGSVEDIAEVLRAASAKYGPVGDVLHLWCLDGSGATAAGADELLRGFHSLLQLARALQASDSASRTAQVQITVVANRVETVSGGGTLVPEKATLHGACLVIPQEYPDIGCQLIDVQVEAASERSERLARQIAGEIEARSGVPVIAYRGRTRWAKSHRPLREAASAPSVSPIPRLRKGGVYFVTGGLGGVGLALARHLAKHWQARLVLVSRTPLGRAGEDVVGAAAPGNVRSGRQVPAVVQELEVLGAAGVLVLAADVTDAAQMHATVGAARKRFGEVHGAIHAAGVAGGGAIATRTREAMEKVLAPKLQGTRILTQVLGSERLDFLLLCSSLTAVVGGFGQADYCAANCVLDAMAASGAVGKSWPVISVNWDAWRSVGMAASQVLPDGLGIDPLAGGEVLERLLAGPDMPQVIVSTIGLQEQIAQAQSGRIADRLSLRPPDTRALHPRPALSTPYEPPTGELEEDVAAMWSNALGIESIGVNDSLFELGGDSLLAVQLLARARATFNVDLHPAALFRTPTIAALAALIESRLVEEIVGSDAPASEAVSAPEEV